MAVGNDFPILTVGFTATVILFLLTFSLLKTKPRWFLNFEIVARSCFKDKLFVIFFTGVVIQTGHTLEHYVQVVQRFWLKLPLSESHGILGKLDIEPVHFWFNIAVLSFLIWSHKLFQLDVSGSKYRKIPMLYGLSIGNIAFQTYHTIEHAVRIYQDMVLHVPAKGILGYYLSIVFGSDAVIVMHFWINMIVYPLMLAFLLIYVLEGHLKPLMKKGKLIKPHAA